MSSQDSTKKIVLVALSLCLVCSVVVSTAAVLLKPAQEANKALDKKRNILQAAGMLQPDLSIDEQFAQITAKVVDLRTGKYTDEVDPERFNQRKSAKDPSQSKKLSSDADLAKISRREDYAIIYLVQTDSGDLDKIILPVHGYGLWSTLYGFLALEADGNTVAGMGFYEHAETPGLGGEVDNPRWKSQWPGKQVYRDNEVSIGLVKGTVDVASPDADWQIDGLSGATITARGVSNLMHFWLGEDGFQPFLSNLKKGDA
ncbi:MAG: Na+-transporting NADH:ubiquinone oxidoreductase subunit C [Halieaceae bacterium]